MTDLAELRTAIERATGTLPPADPQPVGGGCIHQAFRLGEFFVKRNTPSSLPLFKAEERGLRTLQDTSTIRTPTPLCSGLTSSHAFLALEYLPLDGDRPRSHQELGRRLAALHRCSAHLFGADHDNFIGATPQPNQPSSSWIDFFREHRLGHMLRLAEAAGFSFPAAPRLLDHLHEFFPDAHPLPSLLHGDLWAGNAAALPDGSPVVFDPAVYYGDRETDLAMTSLFGGFSDSFYDAYHEAWPLPPAHSQRRDLYNLYHILNHAVLFGGGYARQANHIIQNLANPRTWPAPE